MRAEREIKQFVRAALEFLAREADVAACEVYCSSSEHRVARLNYTSDIASRGVEEFKSLNADGFALRIVMRRDAHETATAAIAGDLSLDAVRAALRRARHTTVADPHFPGLPAAPRTLPRNIGAAAASDLMRAPDRAIAQAAWQIVGGAIGAYRAGTPLKLARPGLVIGGDLSLIRDRIAIGSSAFTDIRADQSAHFIASVTALVESLAAKGTATAVGGSRDAMSRAGARLGREAVTRALALRHGERPAAGTWRVVLGPQPIAEILNYMVMPSLTTGAFHAATSAYHGRFGTPVIDAHLSLADDPHASIGPVRRRVTCEGLPATATELIRAGRLVGLLSNVYDSHRLATDEHRAEKLGAGANPDTAFPARNGYRMGESPARRYDGHPGSTGTNVMMRTREGVSERELIGAVGDGLYIGRIWYTYPINGQRAGDFTCTVSGDSYVIRDGKLAAPLAPNCLRINANLEQVFARPLAVGKRSSPAVVWGAPEAYFVPALALEGITLARIGED
ncbi:MAG TPA: metallopeptidase TldD-related protein [Candidatus Binataceae bacterium]|nr:metallopeptidase TldD-related protein [Candidatus Binataceae bacterium]